MNTIQIIIFAGLAAFIIATQIGRHTITPRRFITPILAVVGVSFIYLKGVPTVGGDLPFDLICSLIGIAFGLLAASLVRVERDGQSGRLVTQAGIAYATVWAVVFGGRIAFGWAASNVWQQGVARFSMAHAITGEAAWPAAFVLMAIAMVATRTAVLAVRALWASRVASMTALAPSL